MKQIIIGVDPHKLSATIEVVDQHERLLGSGRFATDKAGYAAMLTLIEQGILQPQRLIERTIGLEQAAALLPRFDRATVAGMTMVDPAR